MGEHQTINNMLKQLYIKNFTLIDELNITFNSGFSVITGETGAGKSIILGAINLLLGQRADSKAIKTGENKCIIEAHFKIKGYGMEAFFELNEIDYDPEDCILRRDISSNGKSRAFINDTPVSLTTLRELGETLVDIHSQHQNLLLQKEDFQLNVVDIMAHNEAQRKQFAQRFEALRAAHQTLEQLKKRISQDKTQQDFMAFQFDELTQANLQPDELATLERETELLSHAEDIKAALFEADRQLNGDNEGALTLLKRSIGELQSIAKVFPRANELGSRLEECHIELKDIGQEINQQMEAVDYDPDQLNRFNERLDLLYSLQQKYHVDGVEALIAIRDDLGEKLNVIENADEQLAELTTRFQQLESECKALAAVLTQSRVKAAKAIETDMAKRLAPLGIPNVKFQIDFTNKPLANDGSDRIAFLFSANKSMPLQPITQVASGGEIARVMLSLKAMISGTVQLPTIIFDEIDTGVSGRVAEMMAQIMHEMGAHHRQVISITHLPQIAARGAFHYKVSKTETSKGTNSQMQLLNEDERIQEIAQMLSGSSVTPEAISNAKSLLSHT